jgi:hypothetical protein
MVGPVHVPEYDALPDGVKPRIFHSSMSLNFSRSTLFAGVDNLENLCARRAIPTFSPFLFSEYRLRNFFENFA